MARSLASRVNRITCIVRIVRLTLPVLPLSLALLLPSVASAARPSTPAASPSASSRALEIVTGAAGAPVSIVVFSDYECPYSAQLYFQLKALEQSYPGRLRLMMRQVPLTIHPESPLAHEAALAAAAQGKLGEMSDLLFANQNRLDRDSLLADARQLGLNMAEFEQALDKHLFRPVVEEDLLEAEAMGIQSTPTLFLNGQRLNGVQSEDVLAKSVAQEIARADALKPDALKSAPQAEAQTTAATLRDEGAISAEFFSQISRSATHVRGSAKAPVTIVEFSDFQCPFCRRAVKPIEDLLAARPSEVRLVYRNFPLDFHQFSEQAHEAALAAGAQGKFWPMHDLIFANQSQLQRADLLRYAAQLKLDVSAFERALDSHQYAGEIAADRALGVEAGVDGTPTLFVNGKRISGARSLVELEQLADQQAALVTPNGSKSAAADSQTAGVVVPTEEGKDTELVVLGPQSAPVHVTWFTDVRSPLAQRTAALLHAIDQANPGQIRIEFKTLQLANHPDAELASRALLAAAAQHRFWPMYEALAAASAEPGLDRAATLAKASAAGLDAQAFEAALDDASITDSLERDRAEEYRRSVFGSPSIFIADQRIDGLQPERVYQLAISAALAAHDKAKAQSTVAAR
jgi:protein-disulfide isomerase